MTWLLLMTEPVIVALPEVVVMPPPSDDAWFVMIWQEETVSVPWLAMPPPLTAELPLTVQLVSVAVAAP